MVKENPVENPSCVDLFLTDCSRSFQSTFVISTGISDCHKMIITVLKTTFEKARAKEIVYRSYKNFDNYDFRKDLRHSLAECGNYNEFERCFLEVLNAHAPIKKWLVRANEVPYMTKALRKAIANRSRLCSRLYKRKYANLDLKKITDRKHSLNTAKPFFSDKGAVKTDITLIEGNEIVQEDSEVAKILGDFFKQCG